MMPSRVTWWFLSTFVRHVGRTGYALYFETGHLIAYGPSRGGSC